MRKILGLVVAASLAFPAVASAKEYATAGVIEVGGEIGFTSRTTTYTPEQGDDVEETATVMELSPTVGYFLMDQLELLGQLSFESTSSKFGDADESTTSGFGLGVGAAYLIDVGGIHVGPQGLIGFSNTTQKAGDAENTLSGPEIQIAGVAKVPFGEGGVLGAGLGIEMAPASTADFDGTELDASTMSFGLQTSITFYF